MVGMKFGRLTVVEHAGKHPHGGTQWKCVCDCGNERVIVGYRLKDGHTKSCGCYSREQIKTRCVTHNQSHNPLYFVWKAMIARCNKPNNPNYFRYGARGIRVCKDWLNVQKFIEWGVANGYQKGLEIERIDNNGNYEPGNCKWATRKEQIRNRRNNIYITLNGRTKVLADWATHFGLNVNTVQYRYYRGDRGEHLFRPINEKCNWRLKKDEH